MVRSETAEEDVSGTEIVTLHEHDFPLLDAKKVGVVGVCTVTEAVVFVLVLVSDNCCGCFVGLLRLLSFSFFDGDFTVTCNIWLVSEAGLVVADFPTNDISAASRGVASSCRADSLHR